MLADEICDQAFAVGADSAAADIRIGLGYTAVLLADGRCGLAYTLHEEEYESCCVIPESGTLAGRKASELSEWLKMSDTTACAIGLATINAVVGSTESAVESDIMEMLQVESEDIVGMVGYFGPLVKPLRERVRSLHIFERRPNPGMGILPETASRELLPQCRVVVLSATTLLNHTIDGLLDCCKAAREIVLLGPSTPFLPEVFRRHGVTMLSGLQVVDAAQVLRVVSEGGGTRQFGRAARKVSLRIGRG